ncbi:MAG: transposase [Deltaproteobacteria bacterium]|nr:transposase [Deltaproteobacteria bacterium]
MPNYRRDYSGCSWFFTVVTRGRAPILVEDRARACLRKAVDECRERFPFAVDGWVLLPEHLHCLWTLPEEDPDYSRRWSLIKRRFTQSLRDSEGSRFWQDRFWAHRIHDERDFENHMAYIHFNPVKHGHASSPADWPWSTFHRWVRAGVYPRDWGRALDLPPHVGSE